MKNIEYNIPVFEKRDKANLRIYSEQMANALKTQLDKFGNPLIYKGTLNICEELYNIENPKNGEIYTVLEDNTNYIYNGKGWEQYSLNINLEAIELTKTYKGTTITASTIEGTGRIKKLYGKTEEIGEGEKSPDNPYQIKCVADDINLLNYYGEVIEVTATSDDYNITTNYFAKLIKRKKIHNFL